MSSQTNVNNRSGNPVNAANPAAGSPKRRARALRRHDSLLLLHPVPATHRAADVKQQNNTQAHAIPTTEVLLQRVARCKDLWFEDGDVIVWAQNENNSLLYRVHRHVLKQSGVEPFCTVVDCDYPNPETSGETFMDGIWVLKYDRQDPIDIMYLLKWMYERP